MFTVINNREEYAALVKEVKDNFSSENAWLDFFDIFGIGEADENIGDLFTDDGSVWVIGYAPKSDDYPYVVYVDFVDLTEEAELNLYIVNWASLKELGINK